MREDLTRRSFLGGAALAGTAIGLGAFTVPETVVAAGRGPQIAGVGRIGDNLPGLTLPSPSDFGFTVFPDGGTFLCSMFGPTGGFLGCQLMTVQGLVTAGSLHMQKGGATFAGKLDLFLFPDIFGGGPYLNAAALEFMVTVRFGGPGKGSMVLHIPSVTANVGGDTGGVLRWGRIERKRVAS